MRNGYKKTEIGVIPFDWKVVRLGDIATFYKGKGISKNDVSNRGIDCIRYGELYTKYQEEITEIFSKTNLSKEKLFLSKKNDILIPASGETAIDLATASCVSKDNVALGGDINIIRTELNGIFLSHYLNTVLKTKIASLAQGSSVIHLYSSQLKNLNIAYPPLIQQKKIAKILSTTDNKIEAITKQIEKAEMVKKGLMQKLLFEGVGHSKFKDSKIGKIPESWNVKKLENIANVKGGKRLPKGYSLSDIPTPFPYIRVTNMSMGGINNKQILYVPIDIQDKIKKYIISKNDLFIAVAGNTLGMVGDIPTHLDNANLTENADKICNIKINKKYLLYVLLSNIVQKEIQHTLTTTAQPKLALTRIKTFKIPCPPIKEQKKIATILTKADQKIEILKAKKEQYQILKTGLMQKLLTGEIGVGCVS